MRVYRSLAFSLVGLLAIVAHAQVPTDSAKTGTGMKHTFLIQGLHCPPLYAHGRGIAETDEGRPRCQGRMEQQERLDYV